MRVRSVAREGGAQHVELADEARHRDRDRIRAARAQAAVRRALRRHASGLVAGAARLLEESPKVLIQDWFKDGQSRTRVRAAVEKVLDDKLPETYYRAMFTEKCNVVFETMVNYASQGMKWTVAA